MSEGSCAVVGVGERPGSGADALSSSSSSDDAILSDNRNLDRLGRLYFEMQ